MLSYGAAIYLGLIGMGAAARMLAWPSLLLISWVPEIETGTPEVPFREFTPVHMLAGILGIPAGFLLYSAIAWIVIAALRARH